MIVTDLSDINIELSNAIGFISQRHAEIGY